MAGKHNLNEYFSQRNLPLPNYVLAKKEGPDHVPVFTVVCSVHNDGSIWDETSMTATGQGICKKIAENEAAATLLCYLKEKDDNLLFQLILDIAKKVLALAKVLKVDNPLTCPECLKVFHDGLYHQSTQKLFQHMQSKYQV